MYALAYVNSGPLLLFGIQEFFYDGYIESRMLQIIKINETPYSYQHNPNCYNDFFGFLNRTGQQYQFIETTFTNDYCTNNSANLEWKIRKDKIFFYIGSQVVLTYKVIVLTEKKFIFSFENDIDQDGTIDSIEVTASPYDPYNMFENK